MPRRCRGIRGDAPQGYLFRFAPLRGHRPLRKDKGCGVWADRVVRPTEEYMRCGGVTAEREVRGGERCFEQVLRCFFVRCAKFGGETQNGVDIGVGECHN